MPCVQRPCICPFGHVHGFRIEAFDEPDLDSLIIEPELATENRPVDFKPYDLNRITRHASRSWIEGQVPQVTGLLDETDTRLLIRKCVKMMAKRRGQD